MNRDPYLENRVLTADPLELVHLLYQHALDMVRNARESLAAGDIAARSRSICRAIDAVSELEASLDLAHGGEIGRNLAGLYRYTRARLTAANVRQQDAPLAEVQTLLATLAEAWRTLYQKQQKPAEPVILRVEPREPKITGNPFFADTCVESARHGWSV